MNCPPIHDMDIQIFEPLELWIQQLQNDIPAMVRSWWSKHFTMFTDCPFIISLRERKSHNSYTISLSLKINLYARDKKIPCIVAKSLAKCRVLFE